MGSALKVIIVVMLLCYGVKARVAPDAISQGAWGITFDYKLRDNNLYTVFYTLQIVWGDRGVVQDFTVQSSIAQYTNVAVINVNGFGLNTNALAYLRSRGHPLPSVRQFTSEFRGRFQFGRNGNDPNEWVYETENAFANIYYTNLPSQLGYLPESVAINYMGASVSHKP